MPLADGGASTWKTAETLEAFAACSATVLCAPATRTASAKRLVFGDEKATTLQPTELNNHAGSALVPKRASSSKQNRFGVGADALAAAALAKTAVIKATRRLKRSGELRVDVLEVTFTHAFDARFANDDDTTAGSVPETFAFRVAVALESLLIYKLQKLADHERAKEEARTEDEEPAFVAKVDPADDEAASTTRAVLQLVDTLNKKESAQSRAQPSIDKQLELAQRQILTEFETSWHRANIIRGGETREITVEVPVKGLQDWASRLEAFGSVAVIDSFAVRKVDTSGGLVTLSVVGDDAAIANALGTLGLQLSRLDDGRNVIEPQ